MKFTTCTTIETSLPL